MEQPTLAFGMLQRVHHIAFNVRSLEASRHFWGKILGFHELTGTELPETLKALATAGKVASFVMPDDTIIDLFFEPDLAAPNPDPTQQFTRANHLAFDIDPDCFDRAVSVLKTHQVPIDHGPVSRPTGRGIYFYDPDGFMVEIRCNAAHLPSSASQLAASS